MKKIEAVMKPFKLDEVKQALEKEHISRMTVFEVKGAGSQQGKVKCYRGAHYLEDEPEVKVEVVTEDDKVDQVRDTIIAALRTGDLCDGEVAVLPMEGLVRIRIGRCS
jgi:nitrogen regulatory protein P-II 1